jgi:predicted nucleic acid-binding protein
MDTLEQRLGRHTIIALDTSVFIYHLEAHPTYLSLTETVLGVIQGGQIAGVTSVVTLMELTVHPWRQQQPFVAREYEALLVHFPHLLLADVTRDIARDAARLRALHNLGPADALQVATARHHRATAFLTNDVQLRRLDKLLDVVLLNEFV